MRWVKARLKVLDGLPGSDSLLVAADEVVNTQIVDIGIVGVTLTQEILAEIRAVGADGLRQILQG